MKSAVRRTVLVGTPALALVLVGCSVHEQTQGWYPRYDGVTAEAGDIGIRNVVVVSSGDGRATVLAAFANRGDADQLVEVRVADAVATPVDGPVEIPARGYAALGPSGAATELTGVEVGPGLITEVEFLFANGPRTTVDAIVKDTEGAYATVEFSELIDETGVPDDTGTGTGTDGDGEADEDAGADTDGTDGTGEDDADGTDENAGDTGTDEADETAGDE